MDRDQFFERWGTEKVDIFPEDDTKAWYVTKDDSGDWWGFLGKFNEDLLFESISDDELEFVTISKLTPIRRVVGFVA